MGIRPRMRSIVRQPTLGRRLNVVVNWIGECGGGKAVIRKELVAQRDLNPSMRERHLPQCQSFAPNVRARCAQDVPVPERDLLQVRTPTT